MGGRSQCPSARAFSCVATLPCSPLHPHPAGGACFNYNGNVSVTADTFPSVSEIMETFQPQLTQCACLPSFWWPQTATPTDCAADGHPEVTEMLWQEAGRATRPVGLGHESGKSASQPRISQGLPWQVARLTRPPVASRSRAELQGPAVSSAERYHWGAATPRTAETPPDTWAESRAFTGLCSQGYLAESEGFEPPVPCGTTVFKTAALNRSASSPRGTRCPRCDSGDGRYPIPRLSTDRHARGRCSADGNGKRSPCQRTSHLGVTLVNPGNAPGCRAGTRQPRGRSPEVGT